MIESLLQDAHTFLKQVPSVKHLEQVDQGQYRCFFGRDGENKKYEQCFNFLFAPQHTLIYGYHSIIHR